jgi:hypothetical protein
MGNSSDKANVSSAFLTALVSSKGVKTACLSGRKMGVEVGSGMRYFRLAYNGVLARPERSI